VYDWSYHKNVFCTVYTSDLLPSDVPPAQHIADSLFCISCAECHFNQISDVYRLNLVEFGLGIP
jgi:hypothetical protein